MQRKENPNVYKWLSIIILLLIPIAGSIAFIFDLNRSPVQFSLMFVGLCVVSWRSWSKYKQYK
ncbi:MULTISPECIES: hypothetical protein [Metabacillus]|uniref:Uncharacterized protein n=1 Tax=Metabacillus endolithicus TaxID=1535204 RepID=A0ABW5C2M8_9BACI|nr:MULTISPECIES: hypothetical protein [Metabacillus]MCM3164792.1 hypothetical protein [Metabacillus litoralis]MCM3412214.1 hypothetical protein [Metabacillus litoralis]UPG65221.1 hypothetical protein MVE64_09655 [Metabacillus endolithicus]